jgi:hypothetical protein
MSEQWEIVKNGERVGEPRWSRTEVILRHVIAQNYMCGSIPDWIDGKKDDYLGAVVCRVKNNWAVRPVGTPTKVFPTGATRTEAIVLCKEKSSEIPWLAEWIDNDSVTSPSGFFELIRVE